MKKKYDEAMVVNALRRNPAIDIINNVIVIIKGTNFVGNGTLGKISYLVNYCGYSSQRIDPTEANKTKLELLELNKHKPKRHVNVAETGKVILNKKFK